LPFLAFRKTYFIEKKWGKKVLPLKFFPMKIYSGKINYPKSPLGELSANSKKL